MKFAKGCTYWIKAFFAFGVISIILSIMFYIGSIIVSMIFSMVAMIFFFFAILFIYFFRDPDRIVGKHLVAPADGKIIDVSEIEDKDIEETIKISTYMSLFNVHVNRFPLNGTVKKMFHHIGSHSPAYTKSADENERLVTILDTDIGEIKIVQIAGIVARRILPYVKTKDIVDKGQRIGIIKFGSRVDLYLPRNKIDEAIVKEGQKVKAGEDSIAKIHD